MISTLASQHSSSEYRSLCRETKRAIKNDRNALLEREASGLSGAFSENTFRGCSLLEQQHRTRTDAVLPPESDFTDHYRSHGPGGGVPLELHSCELPPCADDDTLTCTDFDAGVRSLNSNRSAGQDNVVPEYIKHGGPVLLQWTFVFMTRI